MPNREYFQKRGDSYSELTSSLLGRGQEGDLGKMDVLVTLEKMERRAPGEISLQTSFQPPGTIPLGKRLSEPSALGYPAFGFRGSEDQRLFSPNGVPGCPKCASRRGAGESMMSIRSWLILCFTLILSTLAGCGTSRWTDTSRTATEQLLISDAIDRAVSRVDFRALAGKTVFLDDTPIRGMTDSAYLSSTIRQHLLASGAILKENKAEAEYVLEVRAGAIGTDRHDVTYGIPAINIPTLIPPPVPGVPNQLPEVPIAKKTHQRAVVKIAFFAYNRNTGRPVWQSGTIPVESDVRALWLLGAGPFVRSKTGNKLMVAGDVLPLPPLHLPLDSLLPDSEQKSRPPSVSQEAFFTDGTTRATAQENKEAQPSSTAQPDAPVSQVSAGGSPSPTGSEGASAASSTKDSSGKTDSPPPEVARENQGSSPHPDGKDLLAGEPEQVPAEGPSGASEPDSPQPGLLPPLDLGELLPALEESQLGTGMLRNEDPPDGLEPTTSGQAPSAAPEYPAESPVRNATYLEPYWPFEVLEGRSRWNYFLNESFFPHESFGNTGGPGGAPANPAEVLPMYLLPPAPLP